MQSADTAVDTGAWSSVRYLIFNETYFETTALYLVKKVAIFPMFLQVTLDDDIVGIPAGEIQSKSLSIRNADIEGHATDRELISISSSYSTYGSGDVGRRRILPLLPL